MIFHFLSSGVRHVPALVVCTLVLAACGAPTSPPPATPILPVQTITPALEPKRAAPTATRQGISGFIEATPAEPVTVRGTFVYGAGDGSLSLQPTNSDDATTLVDRSKDAIAQLPTFSPDGKQIVLGTLLFLPDGNMSGDIQMIDAAGKNLRTVVHAGAKDIVYTYPRFAPNGQLLVTRAEDLQTTNQKTRLEWANVDGKGGTRVALEDAQDADIAPDGKRIVFVRYNVQTSKSSLWTANADGTNEKQWVDGDTFASIMSPRFSPDGQWIAFGVHGGVEKHLPTAEAPLLTDRTQPEKSGCAIGIMMFCFVERAEAHMAPGALWRVNVETGKFQQLTDVYDDSPVPAWSSDGTQIAIHDFTGIRLIDLARKEIYDLYLEDGGTGGFDWSDR